MAFVPDNFSYWRIFHEVDGTTFPNSSSGSSWSCRTSRRTSATRITAISGRSNARRRWRPPAATASRSEASWRPPRQSVELRDDHGRSWNRDPRSCAQTTDAVRKICERAQRKLSKNPRRPVGVRRL